MAGSPEPSVQPLLLLRSEKPKIDKVSDRAEKRDDNRKDNKALRYFLKSILLPKYHNFSYNVDYPFPP